MASEIEKLLDATSQADLKKVKSLLKKGSDEKSKTYSNKDESSSNKSDKKRKSPTVQPSRNFKKKSARLQLKSIQIYMLGSRQV